MTEQEYSKAEGVRRSDLWRMEESPEKFKYFLEHPMEQTSAMAFGSACHKMILEPGTFCDEYAVAPQINRLTKEGKAQWVAFCEENSQKTIVKMEDADTMREMEIALERCGLAAELLRGDGETETPIFWVDPDTGEKCKVKCDRVVTMDGQYVIVDYKTALSANTDRFNNEIFRLGYHMQAGMYTDGLMYGRNLDYRPRFLFVVQEKKAPYSLNVIEVTEDVMNAGCAKFHELLEKYHECAELDVWPGYVESNLPNETFLPGWVSIGEEEDV